MVKTPRDPIKPVEYYDAEIAISESQMAIDWVQRYREAEPYPSGAMQVDLLIDAYLLNEYLSDVRLMYSRGDELQAIKQARINPSVDRFAMIAQEIDKFRELTDENWIFTSFPKSHRLLSVYALLAWYICFDADEQKLRGLLPYVIEAGQDKLADAVISRYDPNRTIAKEVMFPKQFEGLSRVVDASADERIDIVVEYARKWPATMGTLAGPSLGIAVKEKVKTYDQMVANPTPLFGGYWAWELALVVKVFGIDGTRLREFPFYPAELIDFTR